MKLMVAGNLPSSLRAVHLFNDIGTSLKLV
jgi:hypothetical protein